LQTTYPVVSRQPDAAGQTWLENFAALGEKLQVSVRARAPRLELRMAS